MNTNRPVQATPACATSPGAGWDCVSPETARCHTHRTSTGGETGRRYQFQAAGRWQTGVLTGRAGCSYLLARSWSGWGKLTYDPSCIFVATEILSLYDDAPGSPA